MLHFCGNLKFLGSTISQDLKWVSNIDTIIKKAQLGMYLMRMKFNLPKELLIQFYTAIIQSVSAHPSRSDLDLPSIQDYMSTLRNRPGNITADPSQPVPTPPLWWPLQSTVCQNTDTPDTGTVSTHRPSD